MINYKKLVKIPAVRVVPIIICGMTALASPAMATTVIGSSAYGTSLSLSLLSVVKGTLAPVASVGGFTTPGYSVAGLAASVSNTTHIGLTGLASVDETLKTGIIKTSAAGNIPTPLNGAGSANSLVNGLNFTLAAKAVGGIVNLNLLTIKSSAVTSMSSVSDVGGLTATGASSLAGLTISGLGLGDLVIDGSLFVNPGANTVLLDLLGIKIVLNEQVTSGNQLSSKGITTNAIHVIFSNYSILKGLGILNGDVVIGHTRAYIVDSMDSAVPEPAIWLQMIVGFGLAGSVLRRRRSPAAA